MHLPVGMSDASNAQETAHCLAALARAESVDELVAAVRASARQLSGADGIAIVLREGDICHYVEEDAIGPLWKGGRFPAKSCISGWAMERAQTVVIPDVLLDPRIPQDLYRATFVRSLAMVPVGDPVPVAAIGAYWASAAGPRARDVEAVEELARATAGALARLGVVEKAGAAPDRGDEAPLGDQLQRLLPKKRLPPWQGHALAAGLVLLTAMLRLSLMPVLGSSLFFTVFFPAIFVAALLGGAGPAATSVAASTLAAVVIDLTINGPADGARVGAWVFFALTASLAAAIAVAAREAIDRQEGRNSDLELRDQQMATIAREIDHRARNTLSVASALVQLTARRAASPEEMADTLVRQFGAMAAAQNLALKSGSEPVALAELVETCLQPFLGSQPVRIAVDPALAAPRGAEATLALALYELATNAFKHGALSAQGGAVEIASEAGEGQIALVWRETGGPPVTPPDRRSAGTRLIETATGNLPGGRTELRFEPEGVTCRFLWDAPQPG